MYDKLDPRVFALKLTPGLDSRIFSALAPSYDAVILETFGIGGIPEQGETGPCFQDAIYSWVDSGRIAVMTTQVPEEGLDLGVYEVGRAYANHPGILRGADMTPRGDRCKDHVGARANPRCGRGGEPVQLRDQPRPLAVRVGKKREAAHRLAHYLGNEEFAHVARIAVGKRNAF